MGRRGNGEGTISKRMDGRWQARLILPDGKRKHFYATTRQQVAQRLAAAIGDRDRGLPVAGEQQTVGQFLTVWLAATKQSVRPSTWVRYTQLVNRHLIPALGRVRLSRLAPQQVQALYAQKLEEGLSPTTVHHLHAVLHRALASALKLRLAARNVSELVERPRMAQHEMQVLSPEQVRRLLATASGSRLEALYVLAISTGMRQGELLALRWRDVDLEGGSLQVRATLRRTKEAGFVFTSPKTARSRRRIALPAATMSALRRHRARQLDERVRLGPTWADQDLVFANEVGRPIEAQNLMTRSFRPLLKQAGLPAIRFHDLRHTAATLLFGHAVNPKIVSELLGHASVTITLDLYSHVLPDMQQVATAAMDAVLSG